MLNLPKKEERVLVWLSTREHPFVGYWTDFEDRFETGGDTEVEWRMDVENLNCDTHCNDVHGEVVAWLPLPAHPVMMPTIAINENSLANGASGGTGSCN